MTLDELNATSASHFTAALATVFEDSPWVAERAAAARPFATVTALHAAMFDQVRAAPAPDQLAFLRGHPDLAGLAARTGTMGAHSTDEQAALGLDRLDAAQAERFAQMNAAYRDRFGIPFILCVRRHTRASILDQFARRLGHDAEAERAAALAEVFLITRLRLAALVDGPGQPVTTGALSTHVLDTAAGRPAQGVRIELLERDGEAAIPLATGLTDADGRTDGPLLSGAPLRIGGYELRFHVGAYFAARGAATRFLDVVPVRFAITEAEAHYHVPLLVSPGGYTTYRGS